MITERQENILNLLIKEYIDNAHPISSELLKKKYNLDVSPATIRNDFKELTEKGYIAQTHISAGRIPSDKAYRYFVEKIFSDKENMVPSFIVKEIESAKEKINKELHLAKKLTGSLEEISSVLYFNRIEENMFFDVLKIVCSSRVSYNKNIDIIKKLIKDLESF